MVLPGFSLILHSFSWTQNCILTFKRNHKDFLLKGSLPFTDELTTDESGWIRFGFVVVVVLDESSERNIEK